MNYDPKNRNDYTEPSSEKILYELQQGNNIDWSREENEIDEEEIELENDCESFD